MPQHNGLTISQLAQSVACCGLVCALCHKAEKCAGCRFPDSDCDKKKQPGGCYQYHCCTAKGLRGCWECEQAPCGEDMFGPEHDLRLRVFIRCLQQEGPEALAAYLLRNERDGIHYGHNMDYDHLGSEEAVWQLLHKGKMQE